MTTSTMDRRVRRTRNLLRDAFVDLILEQGYDATTISDIVERADVGRSTFYSHFPTKEALLESGLSDLRSSLLQYIEATSASSANQAFPFLEALFDHVGQHIQVYQVLTSSRGGRVVDQYFRNMLAELVAADLDNALKDQAALGPARRIANAYISGALMSLIIWWIDQKAGTMSVGEVCNLFREMTIAAISAISPDRRDGPLRD